MPLKRVLTGESVLEGGRDKNAAWKLIIIQTVCSFSLVHGPNERRQRKVEEWKNADRHIALGCSSFREDDSRAKRTLAKSFSGGLASSCFQPSRREWFVAG